ncbi:auxin-responsive protein IAA25 isoform X2 [Sorghum bicolor]|nr:auxin-responsive protein IAA25 isoform X2 [Sorghum bicolor]|eukprot:XP_021320041.1 auxin-responsive protein IAA25 isoform X2 [Sorghum bicolor]
MKSSSSAAQRLKLKQEQADDCSEMQGSHRGLMSSLELRLGISSDNGGGSGDPWLGVGVHPWSLAGRQAEKVALEQDHQRPPPPQPVGWPPVGAFRRSHLQVGAKAVEEPTSKVKLGEQGPAPARSTMFVKVNMEGCAVGRKVDLQAHCGYASLSRALQAMFHGFLSDGQWRIAGREEDDDDDDEQPEPTKKGENKSNKKAYILLYEDNEGDRMLVGDVPWE